MAFEISAELADGTAAKYADLFRRVAQLMPNQLARFTKVAGITLCGSLKARTRKAPKKIRSGEYSAAPADIPPKYITYRRGQKLATALHRWRLTRKKGTPGENTHLYFVYSRGPKRSDRAAERKELIQYHGTIFHAGLAKKSWGWAAKGIASSISADISYKKRKHDRRDPRDDVSGEYRSRRVGKDFSATEITIENRLDYITEAMRPGAVDEAAQAALKSIYWKCDQYWERISQRMELGSPELMSLPTFLDERGY